jgi:hypothetical protein
MQQQRSQDENIACAGRAWHVLIERHVRDLPARHDTIEVAAGNDAEGSGLTISGARRPVSRVRRRV